MLSHGLWERGMAVSSVRRGRSRKHPFWRGRASARRRARGLGLDPVPLGEYVSKSQLALGCGTLHPGHGGAAGPTQRHVSRWEGDQPGAEVGGRAASAALGGSGGLGPVKL